MVGQLAGHMTGGMLCLAVWLGDELGYYRALAAGGAMAADDLAGTTGCNPRLTREWLDGQASAGLVSFDATGDRYSMSGEVAALLADESTPTFMGRQMKPSIHRDGRRRREGPRPCSATADSAGATTIPACTAAPEWFCRPGSVTASASLGVLHDLGQGVLGYLLEVVGDDPEACLGEAFGGHVAPGHYRLVVLLGEHSAEVGSPRPGWGRCRRRRCAGAAPC